MKIDFTAFLPLEHIGPGAFLKIILPRIVKSELYCPRGALKHL